MNVITRGIRNAFRNGIRTVSVVIILGLSIGLCLTMLIAHQAVVNKIKSVESSIGNTVSISPAGLSNFSQVNNSLTSSQLSKVASLPNVTEVTEELTGRLTTIGSSTPNFGFGGQSSQQSQNSNNQTSLTSPVKLNVNSNGSGAAGGFHIFVNGGTLPSNFSLPVTIVGTNNPSNIDSTNVTISSGNFIDGNTDTDKAMVSTTMASKNNLKVGSTFTAYGTTLTVAGIFSSSTQAANGDIVVALPTEQRLSGQTGDVTSAVATVDSIDNLSSATTAIKNTLGSNADVTSSVEQANEAVQPLNSVKSVSLYSLIGAVVAGAVIILLIMIMLVRERKREIGVIKAIGGSNLRIISQFMVEALTFTLLGLVIGLFIGIVGGSPVTNALVNSTSTSTSTSVTGAAGAPRFGGGGAATGGGFGGSGGGGGGFFRRDLGTNSTAVRGFRDLHAEVGISILFYGVGAAILIALAGSALAAGMIAKVRPSEVMRTE